MTTFNFKKEAKVYLVTKETGLQYNIDIQDISFNQTFTENSYEVKDLHTQYMFEASIINKANPANFAFVAYLLQEDDHKILLDVLLNLVPIDIYVSTNLDVYKLENAVFTTGAFTLEKTKLITLSVEGAATKLTKVGQTATYSIPGTLQAKSSTHTFTQLLSVTAVLDNLDISTEVTKISAEFQNNIEWVPYTTVHGALSATTAENTMYPSDYVVQKRIFAGNITRYIGIDNVDQLQSWNTDAPLYIKVGQQILGNFYGIEFDIPNCTFTNRIESSSVFTQSYDWRMTSNPSSILDNIITYLTK